ncbi:MAG: flagellin [Alphaproteobacteria bacterium]|jgi:flagellin|nr:flagellin [Alphaproteobacteria bacterium]
MVGSVNTNAGSMTALRHLNSTNHDLSKTQEKIASGKKINSPKDDAATLAIAQQMLGEISGGSAVRSGLDNAGAIVDVATEAGRMVSDTLVEMKALAVQASQEGLDQASRDALNAEFNALRQQADGFVEAADFGGTNLVAAGAQSLNVLSNEEGDRFTVAAQDFSGVGLGIDTLALDSSANAGAALSALDAAIVNSSSKLADLGASAKRIESQGDFLGKLSDTLTAGVGDLVDADLAAEDAALAAGQVKQALGGTALGISNAAPKRVLALFQ